MSWRGTYGQGDTGSRLPGCAARVRRLESRLTHPFDGLSDEFGAAGLGFGRIVGRGCPPPGAHSVRKTFHTGTDGRVSSFSPRVTRYRIGVANITSTLWYPDDRPFFERRLDSARIGLEEPRFQVAEALQNGDEVPQDLQRAARWYRLSAEHDHVRAQLRLGLMCANGEGVHAMTARRRAGCARRPNKAVPEHAIAWLG